MADATTHESVFHCAIIGETTLATRCGEVVLNAGHGIVGIVTPNQDVAQWGAARGVPHCSPSSDLRGFLARRPFDYLFSIVNNIVLPAPVLALARRAAINFHDGPLPRYAGVHSTSWALMNRETSHGVSWHVMVEEVDAGPILQQTLVEIRDNDTAFSLNLRCYEAAVGSFASLVAELGAGTARAEPQDLTRRTYYPLYRRPAAAAILDWHRPALELEALVRALEFGPTANPLGRAKLLLDGALVVCAEAECSVQDGGASAGTLVAAEAEGITVATANGGFRITRLLTLDGEPLSLADAIARFELRPGLSLPILDADTSNRINELNAQVCRHEAFWVRRLQDLRSPGMPYLLPSPHDHAEEEAAGIPIALPDAADGFLASGTAAKREDVLAAAFALYLCRLCGGDPFDLVLRFSGIRDSVVGLEELFSLEVPFRIEVDQNLAAADACGGLVSRLQALRKRGTFFRDIGARYPALARNAASPHRTLPVGIAWLDGHDVRAATAGLDACLVIPEAGTVAFWHRPSALSDDDARSMVNQFTTFLARMATSPGIPATQLSLVSEEESHRLLVQWNDTAVSYPGDMVLHHYIERQAVSAPDAVAVRFDGVSYTYRNIDMRANRLAHELQGQGVRRGDLVGLCMERSVELVVGLLAVIKAGAAYVPMDPAYPAERIAFMAEDAGVPVLLTQTPLRSRLPPTRATVVCLDSGAGEPGNDAGPECNTSPDEVAYVIYTSGSTGKPKGAMISHRAICNRLLWMQQQYQLGDDDCVLQKTPYSFDVSVWEFFWPLMVGACLTVARPGGHQDPAYLVDVIQTERITTLHFVPSMLRLFLDQSGVERCTSLKRVFCSGEALPYDLQERFFERCAAELHNLYGPTEAAVDVTFWACRRDDARHIVPIGRPVANTQTYVLDAHGHPTPVGVPGELHLGGVQLALGYLNRPELTKERFIADPFSAEPGARLYRTGDLCRYLPDGAIEFLGRLDFQVKIRGLRIELGEVEAALLSHAGVREAVVVARVDEQDSTHTYLVAYVVTTGAASPAQLRAHLAQTLPDYMVPAAYVVLDRLPLTPSGKVDRKALPAPVRAPAAVATEPPATDVEREVAAIYREVLVLDTVGVNDNFFDMGGDSLRAARIVEAIRRTLRPDLELVRIFEHPTVRSLAAYLMGSVKDDRVAGARERALRQRQALRSRKPPESRRS